MRKGFVAVFVVSCCVASLMPAEAQNQAVADDVWAPVRGILGEWEGTSSGRPGKGTVRRQYRLVLRDRFIEVRNTSSYPPQASNPKGETHEDVGYMSYDRTRKMFMLRQFHVEGFVNTYVSGQVEPKHIVFTTEAIENIPAGWRARETYRLAGEDELIEVFELAEPGKEFAVYSEARLKRQR
jgi:hypothetical protein